MRVQLFGERCSGTNYVQQLIADNTGAEFTTAMGFKHNFPGEPVGPVDLVIVCARHPYTWVQSLYQTPWGAWDTYCGMSMDEFLRTPWRSRYDEYDVGQGSELLGQESTADWCPETREPYPNPVRMRAGKYAAWLALSSRLPVVVAQLEPWQADPIGMLAMLGRYGLKTKELFTPCVHYKGREHCGRYAPRVFQKLTGSQVDWINSQLNSDIEEKLGYSVTRLVTP